MAAVAVPSRVPNRGRRCDVTRAFSGAPDNGGAFSGAQMCAEVLCHPCILGGSPTKVNKIRIGCLSHAFSRAQQWALHSGGPQERATEIRLAPSAMASRGPKSGLKCYVTPAFSGVPNKGE